MPEKETSRHSSEEGPLIPADPPHWRTSGEEPDYRFTLANERTFLAWIRTALAVPAAGVLLDQFSTKLKPHTGVVLIAVLLCVLAGALSAGAYRRWKNNEIAMRHKGPLPHSSALGWLTGAAIAMSAALASLIVAAIVAP